MLLSIMGLGIPGTAQAKTDESAPAKSLVVNILNPDGTTTLVHDYSYAELASLEETEYYATIDAMPAAVGTKAKGVKINALINNAKQYNPNIKWESGQRLVFYVTDAPISYQPAFYTYDNLYGQNRYYYPELVETYNSENPTAVSLKNAVLVEPMLASTSYQARWAKDADLKSTENPVTMDGKESFRFCMGITETEATTPNVSTTNRFARWVYRVDVGPIGSPKLRADTTDNTVGQPIELTFTDNPAWRETITQVKVNENVLESNKYQVIEKKLTINSDVFTQAGDYTITVEAPGYMNSTVKQTITGPSLTVYNVTVDSAISGGAVTVMPVSGSEGDTITVTVTPGEGKQLTTGSLQYTADGETYTQITATEGVYSFVLPAADVTVTAVFDDLPTGSTVWDGSVDVSWYNTTDSVFYIDTPAKLAGLAAIVNGIYNTGANVIGNPDYIVCNVGGGTVAGSTDATWIYGADDFDGKTVYLTADLDMGGVYDSATQTWSGPNYMPIGGQYCMTYEDGTTLIGASWNGTLDGQGHTVKNIYCSRHAGSLGFGFSQSIGLIGRMGVHDSDPKDWYTTPAVKNVAVTGYIYGNRSIGGIVGKSGRSNGSVIENCINYASVSNTDSKGVGGIAGAGWNKLTIKNCANMGKIYTSYSNAGGISGSCEAQVYNSYNVGYVGANNASQAQSLGTNNGGAVWTNCYWLDGSSTSNQAVYNSTTGSTITQMMTSDSMKTADFLTALNADGRAWIYIEDVNEGYPMPRSFAVQDTSTVTSIIKESDPVKLSYIEGDIFDASGLVLRANYSDNTGEYITDYMISNTSELQLTDTVITISGICGGMSYSYDYSITVTPAAPEKNSEDFYELCTVNNMRWFAAQVNNGLDTAVKGMLMNDIDLSEVTWNPIGSSSNPFTGTFDGNEKTITLNITSTDGYVGLFGWVNGGTIKNTTTAGTVSGGPYTGAVAGYTQGASLIQNCVNSATVTSDTDYIGGIAGSIFGTTVLTGCTNNGTVSGLCVVGGIAGGAGYPTRISQCVNNGAVNATGTSGNVNFGLGGIVGWARSQVDQCYNTGTVTGGVVSVGGIAGTLFYMGFRDIEKGELTNDYNIGNVISTSSSTNARTGGLAGYYSGRDCAGVQNCYNAGPITVSNTGEYTAGVIGYAEAITNISNNYYLDSTASKGIGYSTDNAVSKTSAELMALAPDLGTYFKAGTLYPVLTWQDTGNVPVTVTVDSAITGGSVTVNPASGSEGDTITVIVTPAEGKQLVAGSLKYNDGSSDIEITATEGVYSFVLPAANVTVTAQFEDISVTTCTLTFSGEGLTSSPVADTIAENTSITITVTPVAGKRVATFTVGGIDKKDELAGSPLQYTFTITADTTVAVTYENIPVTKPLYKLTPVKDDVYTIGTTPDGRSTMTVNAGKSGFKTFTVSVEQVVSHKGNETVIFTLWRGGTELQLNATVADFDVADTAQAGFNVQPGDVIKVYIVDRLTNDSNINPVVFQ